MQLGNKMKRILIIMCIILSACSPNRMTDEQIRYVADECAKRGLSVYVFNSALVSSAECIDR